MDRQHITPFKIPNFWRERNSKSRTLHVVSMAFHPRDIGTLLIGYTEGAVIYSFKQNKPIKFFQYELHAGAPGGGSDVQAAMGTRRPALTHAIWHPTGTFILTAHDDSSLVFWDPRDGRIVQARTLQDTNVDKPGSGSGAGPGTFSLKEPIYRIAWCSKENPDDTGVLIAGGTPTSLPTKGLTFFELGPTPVYATSSWQVLTTHFETPRRQRILPTPPHAEVVNFCLIPRSSPHYAGSHDPIAVISLLSSGELVTLSFPSGYPIPPHNQLHLSLSYVHPFITNISLAYIDRTRWLGLRENRQQGPKFLLGGAEGQKALKRFEKRNVIQTAHADGTICIWDAGHDDEVENEDAIQVDLARAVGRMEDIDVTKMSLSGAAGEISIGLKSGELVIFRYNNNRNVGREIPPGLNDGPGKISRIMDRTDPGLKQGFLPQILLDERQGAVTALMTSDVGFTCVGYQEGTLVVIDMRGPAIIYNAHLIDFMRQKERGSIRRRNSVGQGKPEWPTCIEFGVMTLEGEGTFCYL
jgi:syntaxin-binding protein 5